jgi:large subunit ribosomal protein L3
MLGLMGKKLGMIKFFSEDGSAIPATVIKVDSNVVVDHRTVEKNGYNALIVGTEDLKENKVKKVYKGIFKENVKPKRHLKEFKIEDPEKYKIGDVVSLDIFKDIKFVDVKSVSKGKGYQGVMKRYNMRGGPSGHGSKFHRWGGSVGQNTSPGRVLKGVKRAGRMGHENVSMQNLKVLDINNTENCIIVKGAVPGVKQQLVYITKAVKK